METSIGWSVGGGWYEGCVGSTGFDVWTTHTCDECGYGRVFVLWFKLLTEPAVIAFLYEHSDFDQSIPFSKLTWKNAPYIRSITQSVLSTDPLRIRVAFPIEDTRLDGCFSGADLLFGSFPGGWLELA